MTFFYGASWVLIGNCSHLIKNTGQFRHLSFVNFRSLLELLYRDSSQLLDPSKEIVLFKKCNVIKKPIQIYTDESRISNNTGWVFLVYVNETVIFEQKSKLHPYCTDNQEEVSFNFIEFILYIGF